MIRSACINVVSGVAQGSLLEPLLLILYTSGLFQVVWNHIVGYANGITIYPVILSSNRLLLFEVAQEVQP